ncbi:MAG: hypothetical protein OIF38_10105 [Cellvibrionaceae bacterium]|nr:hypothetical protein [Cellvibrionaceae bacterium]
MRPTCRRWIAGLSALIWLAAAATAAAKPPSAGPAPIEESFVYQLASAEDNIGELRIGVVRQASGAYLIFEHAQIHSAGWWGTVDIRSNYREAYNREHQLQQIDDKVLEGRALRWTQVQPVANHLRVCKAKIGGLSQTQQGRLRALLPGPAERYSVAAANIAAAEQLLRAVRGEPCKPVYLNGKDFLSSLANLPMYWFQRGRQLPPKIRLLDGETLTVTEYQVSAQGNHYLLNADGVKPIELWLALSERGTPYFSRLQTADDDGPIVIALKPSAPARAI